MKFDISSILSFFILIAWYLESVAGVISSPLASKYPIQVYNMYRSRMKPTTLGKWSSWSTWSSCTRTCGGGVATQTRECLPRDDIGSDSRKRRKATAKEAVTNNVTLDRVNNNVTTQCVGVYKRFHVCNEQPCPPGSADFRQLQCEVFNRKQFMGRVYRWEPFISAPNACELNCRAVGHKFYATFNKTVIDGTPCGGDDKERWVCVTGICKHVGCDGVVGSNKRLDACGVCGGTNNTCRLVSGLFTMPHMSDGYNLIATLPRGACNLSISEIKPSRNYLALRRNSNHQYILNGNWEINWSGEYEGAGTKFTFQRQDSLVGELIKAPGPLLEPVDLMMLYQQPNPGIKYEYMLPMGAADEHENGVIAPPLMMPESKPSSHDVKDGHVEENRPESRRSENSNFPYGLDPQSHTVHNLTPVADEAPKPQPRKTRRRKFAWRVVGFTDCSRSCAGGVKTSIISCIREQNQATVDDRRCRHQQKPQIQTVICNNKPCPAEWVAGDWGECSVTCGEGIQTRDIMCKQVITPSISMQVKEGACLEPLTLANTQKCERPQCFTSGYDTKIANAHWKTGDWSHCSVSCGYGRRSRSVKCMSDNAVVERHDCLHDNKPPHEESCDMGACDVSTEPSSSAHSSWLVTHWTQHCSEDCGTGVQTRKVHCARDTCDERTKPDETRACSSDKQCSGKWFTGPWGHCTPHCGQGKQTRDVVCVAFIRGQHRVALDMNCPISLKPESERVCESAPCVDEWYFGDWTQCSRECGTGVQKREVHCLNERKHPSSNCVETDRPVSKRPCNTHECSSGFISDSSRSHTKVDDDPSTNGAGDQAVPDENGHKGGKCIDIVSNCHVVGQTRLLCNYEYFKKHCCHTCHRNRRKLSDQN